MSVPSKHHGPSYADLLSKLSQDTQVKRYIEIGVSTGHVFSKISCIHAIGVDTAFNLKENVASGKSMVSLFHLTSDDFFAITNPRRMLGGPADLVFLDGMHLFEFLLRDFMNAEALCDRDSIIALHDCLPLNAAMADRDIDMARKRNAGTPFSAWWTGDVWKLIPILRRYRPDLKIILADAEPTGLVFVTDLDPSSDVLKRNYARIVAEFSGHPNDDRAIGRLYADNHVVAAADALDRLGDRRFTIPTPRRRPLLSRMARSLRSGFGSPG